MPAFGEFKMWDDSLPASPAAATHDHYIGFWDGTRWKLICGELIASPPFTLSLNELHVHSPDAGKRWVYLYWRRNSGYYRATLRWRTSTSGSGTEGDFKLLAVANDRIGGVEVHSGLYQCRNGHKITDIALNGSEVGTSPQEYDFNVGERINIHIRTNDTGTVLVNSINSSGVSEEIFPNPFDNSCQITANNWKHIPGSGAGYVLNTEPPVGMSFIEVLFYDGYVEDSGVSGTLRDQVLIPMWVGRSTDGDSAYEPPPAT